MSYELKAYKSTSWNLKVNSNSRFQMYESLVQIHKVGFQIQELRVQVHEFKNLFIDDNAGK